MKKTKKEIETVLIIGIILVSLFFFYLSIIKFYAGYHNIDIGWNQMKISLSYNLNLGDIGNDGIIRTPDEAYMLGMEQIKSGFFGFFLSSFMIGFSLGYLLKKAEDK